MVNGILDRKRWTSYLGDFPLFPSSGPPPTHLLLLRVLEMWPGVHEKAEQNSKLDTYSRNQNTWLSISRGSLDFVSFTVISLT